MELEVLQADVTALEVDAARAHQASSLERVVFAVHGDEAEQAFAAALA